MAARTRVTPYRPDWRQGRVIGWITTTDHKRIGILYICTSLVFFAAGGILALLMRAQLAQPNEHFITKQSYNELFTIHGTTMIFLVVVPIFAGFANFLVPLMIGARDVAFPRLNALSYWLFLFGGIVLYLSFFSAYGASRSGWYAYPPLSEDMFSLGNGQDLWILSLHLLSLGSLLGAINFLATIHNMRAPGMSWMRIPLFVWSIEIYAALLVLVLPVLSVGLTLLLLDRQAGTHFFLPQEGGNAILYQHFFWFFGHPEVYVMVLPGHGDHLGGHPRLLAQADLRLQGDRVLDGGDRLLLDARLGAPHVQRGHAELPQRLLHALLDGDRRADRREDLQLARHDLARKSHLRHRDALGARLHRRVHDRRSLRDLPRRISRRLAGDRQLLRRRAHALRALRRLGVRDLRGPLLLVAEVFGRMLDERLGKAHFWLVFLGFNLTFFRSTCWDCSGCLGGSTPTSSTACGRRTT